MASGYAVELLVSLLQFPEPHEASSNAKSRLGKLPHQIRGNISNQETFTLSGTAFENCTCCSERILKKFEEDEFEFVKMACNSPKELERISGLLEMKEIAETIEDFSFSDDENSEGEEDNGNDF